jgi:hypothetical protein
MLAQADGSVTLPDQCTWADLFSKIRRMWREARTDNAEKEANDLFRRFVAMADYERSEFAAAFDLARTQLELNYGKIAQWSPMTRADLSKKLLQVAND